MTDANFGEPRVVFAIHGYQLLENGSCKRDVMSTGRRMSYTPPKVIAAYIAHCESKLAAVTLYSARERADVPSQETREVVRAILSSEHRGEAPQSFLYESQIAAASSELERIWGK